MGVMLLVAAWVSYTNRHCGRAHGDNHGLRDAGQKRSVPCSLEFAGCVGHWFLRTGRVYSGDQAASVGLINQAFAPDELEARVLEIASRIAQTPAAVVTVNKRFVRAAQEVQGARSIIRIGGDLQAGPHMQELMQSGAAALGDDIKAASKKTK